MSLSSLENIVRIPIVEKVQLKTLTISSLISKKIKTQVNLNNIGFIRLLLIIINILHSIKLKQKTVIILNKQILNLFKTDERNVAILFYEQLLSKRRCRAEFHIRLFCRMWHISRIVLLILETAVQQSRYLRLLIAPDYF